MCWVRSDAQHEMAGPSANWRSRVYHNSPRTKLHDTNKCDEMAQVRLGSHRALGRPGGNDAQLQSLHGRHVQVQA